MIETLFRGKRFEPDSAGLTRNIRAARGRGKDNGEWVNGYYVCADEKHYIFTGETGLFPVDAAHPHLMYRELVRHEVDPETVGRFTGLCDKNDVKIFEGDVMEVAAGGDGGFPWYETKEDFEENNYVKDKTLYTVEWLDTRAFFLLFDGSEPCLYLKNTNLYTEVVGNIHDDKREEFH
ncbi:MAG: YopX family protein [Oscillospiraceae bacterium]|jgi:uncharacterized phage protein (TIGR01671 family)|nr:YopX family protein [Oscillospiraceae bacterium]